MDHSEHDLGECVEQGTITFTAVDSVKEYAERLRRQHPDWVIVDVGWGIIAYDPNDPCWNEE